MTGRILRAALGGVAATAAMTVVILVGREAGLLNEPPPKQITARAARKVGLAPHKSPPAFKVAWVVAHFGYGTSFGVIYALLWRRFISRSRVGALAYGIVLWAVSYFGVMPMTGLFPPPQHDSASREEVMVAAHLVYGLSLDLADRLLSLD